MHELVGLVYMGGVGHQLITFHSYRFVSATMHWSARLSESKPTRLPSRSTKRQVWLWYLAFADGLK